MDQNNSSDKKSCTYHRAESGYDCYTETNNNGNFPHDRMMMEGGDSNDKRRLCALLMLEEADGTPDYCTSLLSPTHTASKTYTVGDAED